MMMSLIDVPLTVKRKDEATTMSALKLMPYLNYNSFTQDTNFRPIGICQGDRKRREAKENLIKFLKIL